MRRSSQNQKPCLNKMITHQPQFIVHDVEYYETKSEIKFTFSIANPNLCNKDLYIRLDDSLFGFRLYGETLNLVQNKCYWISTSNLPFSKWAFFSVEDGGQTIFKEEFRFSKNPCFDVLKKVPCLLNYFYNKNLTIDLSIVEEIFFTESYNKYGIFIEKNDTVVDIGSNVGLFIHYALEKEASRVFSCEPNSKCFEVLQQHFNGNSKVHLNKCAISKNTETQDLVLLDIFSGANFLLKNERDNSIKPNVFSKETVNTFSFLDFVKSNNIDFIDFLKVDCEGGEYDIFIEDNASFLRERVNKIVLEYHGPYHGIIKFLKENGFTIEHGDLDDTMGVIYAKNNSQKIK